MFAGDVRGSEALESGGFLTGGIRKPSKSVRSCMFKTTRQVQITNMLSKSLCRPILAECLLMA